MSKATRTKAIWTTHLAVFVAAQLILAVTGDSWAVAFMRDAVPEDEPLLMLVSRIWLIVFAVDTIWSWWTIGDSRRKAATRPNANHHPLVTWRDDR